jgi:hypothetical protein
MLLGPESGFQRERAAPSVAEAAAAPHRRDLRHYWRFVRPEELPPSPARPWGQP